MVDVWPTQNNHRSPELLWQGQDRMGLSLGLQILGVILVRDQAVGWEGLSNNKVSPRPKDKSLWFGDTQYWHYQDLGMQTSSVSFSIEFSAPATKSTQTHACHKSLGPSCAGLAVYMGWLAGNWVFSTLKELNGWLWCLSKGQTTAYTDTFERGMRKPSLTESLDIHRQVSGRLIISLPDWKSSSLFMDVSQVN